MMVTIRYDFTSLIKTYKINSDKDQRIAKPKTTSRKYSKSH